MAILDTTTLDSYRELMGEDYKDFLQEIIDLFNQRAPQMLTVLKASLQSADAETFSRVAHSLKSNGLTFGAMEFANLALELENMGRYGNLAGADQKLVLLEVECNKVMDELQHLQRSIM